MFLINYSYTIPSSLTASRWADLANGWTIGGQTVAQSGQPYSVYDYSGSVGSMYYGTDIETGQSHRAAEARRVCEPGQAAGNHSG